MMSLPQIDMALATRLTREGRLDEAMAVLRGGASPSPAGPGPAPTATGPASPAGAPLIDLAPPAAPGGTWGEREATAASPRPRPSRAASPSATTAPGGAAPGGVAPGGAAWATEGLGQRLAQGLAGLNGLPQGLPGGRPGGRPGSLPGGLPGGFPSFPGGRAALPAIPAGARWEERRHEGPQGALAYRLYLPASREEGVALPLVVMLHGCTQSPEDFARGTRMNEVAEEMGFLVAWPEQVAAANAQRCWNWFQPGDQGRGTGEPARLAGVIEALVAEGLAAEGQTSVAGLSAGGAAAAVMGAAYPDLVAAVGVHSGLACGAARDLGSALAAMRTGAPGRPGARLPTIVLHGDRDGTVAPANADAVIAQAGGGRMGDGATVETGRAPGGRAFTRTVEAGPDGRARLEQWVLHGAGHAWSGGSGEGSYTDPAGPDASRAIAGFFAGRRVGEGA